jgi:hypothetical protein
MLSIILQQLLLLKDSLLIYLWDDINLQGTNKIKQTTTYSFPNRVLP